MKLLTFAVAAFALATGVHASAAAMEPTLADRVVLATANTTKADGEIRKVDSATKKITIKHGELKHLDMPAMTMDFQVSDPAMIKRVKEFGAKVISEMKAKRESLGNHLEEENTAKF